MLQRLGFIVLTAALLAAALLTFAAHADEPAVKQLAAGRLQYSIDDRGNRLPDFSHCGYAGGDRAIPEAPVAVVVAPSDGDDGARIQAAVDRVSRMPLDASGMRGAVMLAAGRFEVDGQLQIADSGVVLRGAGAARDGTTIVATGLERRPLISIGGHGKRAVKPPLLTVLDEYVPVGATRMRVDSPAALKTGDHVLVTRPSTAEWIAELGAEAFGVGWRPGTRDVRWDRTIVAIEGDAVVVDAPITTALERRYGGATIQRCDWPGRIENVGVEDLRLTTTFREENPHDEEHAWFGVVANHVRDLWVRRVEFNHFAGGAVMLLEGVSRATVEDCASTAPISEVGGYRRHTFFTQGKQTLFLRCWSEDGRHDFAVGHAAPGPNAFVNCFAQRALGESGPIESWASGVLYDNVRIDGHELRLDNRWSSPPGAGWAAANCVLWQCQASVIRCFRPPTANNWAVGTWAEYAGDGAFDARSDFVEPLSLYQAQLLERLGAEAAERVGPFLLDPVGSTNPTPEEAARFAAESRRSAPQLIDIIRERMAAARRNGEMDKSPPPAADARAEPVLPNPTRRLTVTNSWLTVDGQVKTGKRLSPTWWRGVIRPDEAPSFGPSITRFAPGRAGVGLTDELEQVVDQMQASSTAAYDHHYGLWYDRRRDDHLMVRRADGNVAPPFFEQPFARTGQGAAWDALSKYDLTKWNPWYWRRLRDFAALCDQRGLVLLHQNYFQHNILEAGAHWADSPWRPANNVNDTGLPEPPPYVGDKRIFLAGPFYDVTDPRRRELHRGYIRQCLDNFASQSNVIQLTSDEYSGPLEFVQFWFDVIAEWQQETGRNVLVALSAPKNVQDAILADEERSRNVDVIDIRYWCYTAGGKQYAPEGGRNLAPRQHLRQTRLKPGGASEIARAVREYRERFPGKTVTYFAEECCPSAHDGWAVLMGGGSLADVPPLPEKLAGALVAMRPVDDAANGDGVFCLASDDRHYLFYAETPGGDVELNLPGRDASYRGTWINHETGATKPGPIVSGGKPQRVKCSQQVLWLQPN